jgi:hypothetical protein
VTSGFGSIVLLRLLLLWGEAASDLNLEIVSPFRLPLDSGNELDAALLVCHFGAARGMLVFSEYDRVAPFLEEVVDAGYGFTVLDEPRPEESYVREEYVDLLRDWGWSGEPGREPDWL